MIDELHALVINHFGTGQLRFTKFCQRIAGPETKVLFFVSKDGAPLCILKVMRSAEYNGMLKREKEAQESVPPYGSCRAPEVYFCGFVQGRYVYAEEVILGLPLTRKQAARHEREIVEFLNSLPKGLTHGDLGTPNILKDGNDLVVIDWAHAGERPTPLIDAVYYMVRLRRIKDLADWRCRAMPVFMRYTGTNATEAEALYGAYMESRLTKKEISHSR